MKSEILYHLPFNLIKPLALHRKTFVDSGKMNSIHPIQLRIQESAKRHSSIIFRWNNLISNEISEQHYFLSQVLRDFTGQYIFCWILIHYLKWISQCKTKNLYFVIDIVQRIICQFWQHELHWFFIE